MFTGLVEALATVIEVRPEPPGVRVVIAIPKNFSGPGSEQVRIGDSIALNGCCLTVVAVNGDRLEFQAGEETLSRTNLGRLQTGGRVNVERSLRFGDRLGGHFVTGHIDAVGDSTRGTTTAIGRCFGLACQANWHGKWLPKARLPSMA